MSEQQASYSLNGLPCGVTATEPDPMQKMANAEQVVTWYCAGCEELKAENKRLNKQFAEADGVLAQEHRQAEKYRELWLAAKAKADTEQEWLLTLHESLMQVRAERDTARAEWARWEAEAAELRVELMRIAGDCCGYEDSDGCDFCHAIRLVLASTTLAADHIKADQKRDEAMAREGNDD